MAEPRPGAASAPVEEPDRTLDQAQHAVFLVGRVFSSRVDSELRRFARQLLDEQTDRMVLPICFYPGQSQPLPSLFQRSQIVVKPEYPVKELADRIAHELRSAHGEPAALLVVPPEVRLAQSKLNAPNPLARKAAVALLGRVGGRPVLGSLVERLEDIDERVRDEAKHAIIEVYKRQKAADPGFALDLRSLFALDVPLVRIAAAEILATVGDEQGIYLLLALLDDPDTAVRKKAAEALGVIGDPIAIDWIMAHAEDPEVEVRRAWSRHS